MGRDARNLSAFIFSFTAGLQLAAIIFIRVRALDDDIRICSFERLTSFSLPIMKHAKSFLRVLLKQINFTADNVNIMQ